MPVRDFHLAPIEVVEIRIVSIKRTIERLADRSKFYKISQVQSASYTVFGRRKYRRPAVQIQNNDIPNNRLAADQKCAVETGFQNW